MSLMLVPLQVCHGHEQDRILVYVPGRTPVEEVPLQNSFLVPLVQYHFLYLSLQIHFLPKNSKVSREMEKSRICVKNIAYKTEVYVQILRVYIFLNVMKSRYRLMSTLIVLSAYVLFLLYVLKIPLNTFHLNGHTLLYIYSS